MKIPLLLILLVQIYACNENLFLRPEPIIDPIATNNPIDFGDPKPGQQSLFRCFLSSCAQPEKDFIFTNDTLLLKVFERDGELYFTESVTVHSSTYIAGVFTDPIIYKIHHEEGMIILPDRENSKLFHFHDNDTLVLMPEETLSFTQEGCRLKPSTNVYNNAIETGPISQFEIGEILLENKIVTASPAFRPGFLFHDDQHLSLSLFFPDAFVQGWVNIN